MNNRVGVSDGNGQVIYNPSEYLRNERLRDRIRFYKEEAARLESEARRWGWIADTVTHTAEFLSGFFSTATPSYTATLHVLKAMGYVSQSNFDTLTAFNIRTGAGGALGVVVAFWLPTRGSFQTRHFLWRVDTFQIAHPMTRGAPPIIQVMIPRYNPIVFQQMQVYSFVTMAIQAMGQLATGLPAKKK